MAHLQTSVFGLAKDLVKSVHKEGEIAYSS